MIMNRSRTRIRACGNNSHGRGSLDDLGLSSLLLLGFQRQAAHHYLSVRLLDLVAAAAQLAAERGLCPLVDPLGVLIERGSFVARCW
jgi:hypothetical protein